MKKHTVLFVDDEEMMLKSISRSLRSESYKILTALSGEEGLSLLKDYEVSLVVSDQQMPGMDGLAFLTEVRKEFPHILTIMLTGKADMGVAIQAINEVGIYKFILKPWDDLDFKITVRRALESLDLVLERDSLLRQIKDGEAVLQAIEKEHPGITRIKRDKHGYIISE